MSSRFISELQSRVNSQMMIIDELMETNKRLKEGTEVAHLQQQIRELERKLRTSSSSLSVKDSSFPKEMLKRMKQLAHPDKHGNSELANTVMKFLNSL